MLAVADRVLSGLDQGGKTSLAVRQWQRHQIATVEVQQVEDEIDKVGAALSFRGVLDQRKRGDAIRPHPAELAVEIGLPGRERAQRRGDRRIFAGPVEPGAGQQVDIATIEPGVHAIAVVLELVRPRIAVRSFRDQPRELRIDPRGKL